MDYLETFVIDSSVAMKWLNRKNEEHIDNADRILKDLKNETIVIKMPELAKYEVGNALLFKKGLESKAFASLGAFYKLPVDFVTLDLGLATATYKIAYQTNTTFYDASFMSLAIKHMAKLITDNPKHQDKKIEGLEILALKDY